MPDTLESPSQNLMLPPALVVHAGAAFLVPEGADAVRLDLNAARDQLERGSALICHKGFTARRLGAKRPPTRDTLFDILELFAFVRPASFCVPTPAGLARVSGLAAPHGPTEEGAALHQAVRNLLDALSAADTIAVEQAIQLTRTLARAGWAWAALVTQALGPRMTQSNAPGSGLDVWMKLPEWEERGPLPPPGTAAVADEETTARLLALVGTDGEAREVQKDYARLAATALAPTTDGTANVVLAEAGTGLGKTLGYLAPASLWSEKNGPGIWIATYTKNLQRQINQELTALYPDPADKARWTAIRKGRENYLCLLNFQEAAMRAGTTLRGLGQVEFALIARWALASRDGDMIGGDYPAWLETGLEYQLTDRRGECIYSACPHYRRCVIEKSVRRARHARLVVANHALVLTQAALDRALSPAHENTQEDAPERRPTYIFDEGHHLFDAADSAFSAHLTALETSELRRWIRGPEGRRGSRARGLMERAGELTTEPVAQEALEEAVNAARALPLDGWPTRIIDGTPNGPAEDLFALVRLHVAAQNRNANYSSYALEAEIEPLTDGVLDAAVALDRALSRIAQPLQVLAKELRKRLDVEAEDLDSAARARIESVARGIERRALLLIPAWQNMLKSLAAPRSDDFADWFSLEHQFGRLFDVGLHRHWVDPTEPLAVNVLDRAQGTLITSATLRDVSPDDDGWESAEIRTGANHLAGAATRGQFESPFDYAAHTRVLIVNDLNKNDADQVGAAFRELFRASGGGALGLFTAIQRLRGTYDRIAEPLEAGGLPLYAQHVDAMDTGTLVDIFRADRHACLLGTDAVRDGIDVPGDSLRLIVFDRVPWPRPDILHKARRKRFGKRYDDLLTRLRLKQAFGRLIRKKDDRGVFVMLDSATPTRLLTAFPPGVEVERIGLAEAIGRVRDFLPS